MVIHMNLINLMELDTHTLCVTFWFGMKWIFTTYAIQNIRGLSYYVARVKRSSPKLLLRGEGRSPLKYIMSVFLLDFEYFIEKKFLLLLRVWVSILSTKLPKVLPCRH